MCRETDGTLARLFMGSQEEFYRGSTSRTKTGCCRAFVELGRGTAAKGSSSSKEELCKKGDGVQ